MSDNVTYIFPGGAEIVMDTLLVPRKGEVVMVEGKTYRVANVAWDVKIAFNGSLRGSGALVDLVDSDEYLSDRSLITGSKTSWSEARIDATRPATNFSPSPWIPKPRRMPTWAEWRKRWLGNDSGGEE